MKFGMVNESTILNRFVLHTLQRNITHLAVITRKTNIKLGILKGGNWKRAKFIWEVIAVQLGKKCTRNKMDGCGQLYLHELLYLVSSQRDCELLVAHPPDVLQSILPHKYLLAPLNNFTPLFPSLLSVGGGLQMENDQNINFLTLICCA